MQRQELIVLKGKRVKLILTNQYKFSGIVLEVNEESLVLKDKFNENVTINLNSILLISEESDGYN